jgi:hypothetical protein
MIVGDESDNFGIIMRVVSGATSRMGGTVSWSETAHDIDFLIQGRTQ